MTIDIDRKENSLTVKPCGRLNSATGPELAEALDTNFTDDVQQLTIDFSEVDFISSFGIRIIISTYKKLNGRKMSITGANPSVLEVFRLTGLLDVLK